MTQPGFRSSCWCKSEFISKVSENIVRRQQHDTTTLKHLNLLSPPPGDEIPREYLPSLRPSRLHLHHRQPLPNQAEGKVEEICPPDSSISCMRLPRCWHRGSHWLHAKCHWHPPRQGSRFHQVSLEGSQKSVPGVRFQICCVYSS